MLLFCHVRTHSCNDASIITRKPAAFSEPTETAVDEISNCEIESKVVIRAQCGVKFINPKALSSA